MKARDLNTKKSQMFRLLMDWPSRTFKEGFTGFTPFCWKKIHGVDWIFAQPPQLPLRFAPPISLIDNSWPLKLQRWKILTCHDSFPSLVMLSLISFTTCHDHPHKLVTKIMYGIFLERERAQRRPWNPGILEFENVESGCANDYIENDYINHRIWKEVFS